MPIQPLYAPHCLALAIALALGHADVSMAQSTAKGVASPASETAAQMQARLKAFAHAPLIQRDKITQDVTLEKGDEDDLVIVSDGGKLIGPSEGGGGINVLQLDTGAGGLLDEVRNFQDLHVRQGEWTNTVRFDGKSLVEPKASLINTGHMGGEVQVLGKFDNSGTVEGPVFVKAKGRFSGAGTVESLNVAGELVVNPQNGAPTVTRNLALSKSATLVYGVNPEGGSATIKVGGVATLGNATLKVVTAPGEYVGSRQHVVIDAKQVVGKFAKVDSDLAFMTVTPDYSAETQVSLTYARNDVPVTQVVTTENGQSFVEAIEDLQQVKPTAPEPVAVPSVAQAAVQPETAATAAPFIEPLQTTAQASVAPAQTDTPESKPNTAINALLGTNLTIAANAIDQLAGYDAADLGSATLSSIAPISTGMLAAMGQNTLQGTDGNGQVWIQAIGNSGRIGKHLDDYALKHSTTGVLLGTDWAISPTWRLGIAGGKSETRLDGHRFDGRLDSWHVGAYALRQEGPLALRLGALYGGHDGGTKRHVAFNGFSDRLKGRYDATTQQVFGQVGYNLDVGHFDVEPYVQVGYQRYQRDDFREKGGDAALHYERQAQDHYNSDLGLHLTRPFVLDQGARLTPRLSVGWKHTYGDLRGHSRQRLVSGGKTYTVDGIELDRDSLLLEAGLDLTVSPRHTVGLSYKGETGQDNRNGAVMGQWRMMF
ncbi:autotransporter domain-containing protein [Pseudomonas sp. MS646]|uniref:autotransporter outer membrane beta-barrel domain-containing protein n=1 Tax=Pseudomonas sp. MS646 TaxID=3118751 RepID=UPI0030CB09A3